MTIFLLTSYEDYLKIILYNLQMFNKEMIQLLPETSDCQFKVKVYSFKALILNGKNPQTKSKGNQCSIMPSALKVKFLSESMRNSKGL